MYFYKKHIDDTREIFNQGKAAAKLDLGIIPGWVHRTSLREMYDDAKKFYEKGRVFYGVLNQANSMLFKRGDDDCPALIVFSPDPYYDDNPIDLHTLAQHLFSFKNQECPEDIKEVVHSITNEREYCYNVQLPLRLTGDRVVYLTTIMVIRHHLPKKRLCGSVFPILANPESSKHCIILPCEFWSKENTEIFVKNL